MALSEFSDHAQSRLLCPVFTGGFDAAVTRTDSKVGKACKKTQMNAVLAKELGVDWPTPGYVYHLHVGILARDVVASLETGHVVSLNGKNPDRVRYLLHAHKNKVYHRYATLTSEYAYFDLTKLLTVSLDRTWALWRDDGKKLLTRISTDDEPNCGLTLPSNRVLVGCVSPELRIFDIKH